MTVLSPFQPGSDLLPMDLLKRASKHMFDDKDVLFLQVRMCMCGL